MTTEARPPKHVLDAIGGSYDETKYRWNPDTMSLVERTTGNSLSYANVPDPEQGTTVVTDLSAYNASRGLEGKKDFAPGEQPFFGMGDGQEMFISADPNEISEWKKDARTRSYQGIAKVGALVGGAALLGGALSGGGGAAAGGATTKGVGLSTVKGTVVSKGATTAGAGKFAKVGAFLSKNKDLIGNVIGGVGAAIGADRDAKAQRDLMRERVALTSANYKGAKPSGTFRGLAPGTSGQSPSARFEKYDNYEYRYDPAQGRIVRAPVER
jgi:hypothetical protein